MSLKVYRRFIEIKLPFLQRFTVKKIHLYMKNIYILDVLENILKYWKDIAIYSVDNISKYIESPTI